SLASFTVTDVELPREATLTSYGIDDTRLPDTAFLHGKIADANHIVVTGAELRVYAIASDNNLCAVVPYPPADCVIPAQLIGHAASDATGGLRLALPR
ncbi:MAG TPA: hypothetical protein VGC41_28695, partial [Kofleriaceae bacterium]